MRWTIVLVATMAFAACANTHHHDSATTTSSSTAFTSLDALARLVDDGGLGCAPFTPEQLEQNMPGSRTSGTCALSTGDALQLTQFSDPDALTNELSWLRTTRCRIVRSAGIAPFDYVTGPTWLADPVAGTIAQRLADALHGDVIHVSC